MKCDSLSGPQVVGAAMVWRQGQSYSEDLRARVLAAVDGGLAARAAARLFRVSVSYIYQAWIRRRRTGCGCRMGRWGQRWRGSGCRLKNVWPAPSARGMCEVI